MNSLKTSQKYREILLGDISLCIGFMDEYI